MDGLAYRLALPRTTPAFSRAWRRNRWLVLCTLVYVLAGWAAANSIGLSDRFSLTLYVSRGLLMFGLAAIAFALGHLLHLLVMLAIRHPADPREYVAAIFRTHYRLSERLITGLPVLLLLMISASAFTSLKVMIPDFHAYDWDAAFMAWDRWLHGGRDAWQVLQPVFGFSWISGLLSAAYQGWFIVLYGTLFFMAFRLRDPRLRAQFLISQLLCWALLGSLLATVFSSVGPCFYGPLTGDEAAFAPLMAYLEAANQDHALGVLRVQQFLWNGFGTNRLAAGAGISAMPSLHVASSLLFVLLYRRINRPLGIAMGVFFIAVLIGSVHFGYHYAIDGYAAIAITLAIWWGVGHLLGRDPTLGGDATRRWRGLNLSGIAAL